MPWEHCGESLLDDQLTCPACGVDKQSWTINFEVTRSFTVRRTRSVRVSVSAPDGEAVCGQRFEVVPEEGPAGAGETDEEGQGKVICESGGPCQVRFPGVRPVDAQIERAGELVELEADDPEADPATVETRVGKSVRLTLKLANARWGAEEARLGDAVELRVATTAADGETLCLEIFEHDEDGEHDPIETVEATVEGNVARASWTWQQVEDSDDTTTEAEEEGGYTVPEFFFRVEAGGARAESPLLRYRDWFELIIRDPEGEPAEGIEVELTLADGTTQTGTTNGEGVARWEQLPPGRLTYRFTPPPEPAEDEELAYA